MDRGTQDLARPQAVTASLPRGDRFARRSPRRWASAARFAASAILPLLLIVTLSWPMLFTSSGLGGDWEHHLWFVWHQRQALLENGVPSPFLNTAYSVFTPEYLFYGGTINVLAALLSLVPGSTPTTAYVFTYLAAFATAYGGWYWAARMAGLSSWWAHAPALLYVTSACYLMLIYGEGAWPAFVASSMMPMIVAAGLAILRAERTRLLPACALAGSTIVFFGSHTITMVWGSTTIAAAAVLVLALVPDVRRRFPLRSWLRVGAILVPAALVNAWSLLPAIAYSSHTKIATEIDYLNRHYGLGGVALGQVLKVSRAPVLGESPGYALELPTLAIAWAAVGLVIVLWRARRGSWVRVAAIFCAITAALIVTMSSKTILSALPRPFDVLQFAYRLEAYILMGVTASVLAVFVCVQRAGPSGMRWFRCALAPVVLVSVVGAIEQVDAYQRTSLSRSVTFTPAAEVFAKTFNDYAYAPLPVVYRKALPGLEISPAAIHDSSFSATVRERPGQLVYTNIGGGPDLLHITGARVVGRDSAYHLVLAMGSTGVPSAHPRAPVETEHLSIGPAQTAPVVVGRLLSYSALVFLAAELLWVSARRWARRRRRSLR